ncbi:FAD-dependent oxidoreductase [Streptomyces sp. NPDC048002]|uniref:FAD-dependent oxidoreductase n=1 Tax=Streptomyces sp. NPDC048002 TaxID=3154344 RepID=UPI0033F74AA5
MNMSLGRGAGERLVVIGGDAAGMSAASQARRMRSPGELEIVAFERGRFTSYSACGIPYWVGGDVPDRDRLIARTPEEHRARGIDLRMRTEVTEIDVAGGRVRARDLEAGTESWTSYDKLVIATGARPVRPALPGVDAPGVHGVQTLDDGQALLDTLAGASGRRAVVVGAGYIGVEMAEALINRGYDVTVVNRGSEPMSTLDPDMGRLVHKAMTGLGITMVDDAEVTGFPTGDDGRVRAVATADAEYPADVVVLGIGVRPQTSLARAAGLPLGHRQGLLTDLAMRVRGHENIWAGGDCVEVLDLVSGQQRYIALGTHANKHGQIIGTNAGGGYATFPGVVGTAVSKVCELEIARTGLREKDARRAGLQYVTATIESTGRAGYYPGADTMTVKMLAERRTGRLLGVQIVGREGAAKRVDVAAVALTAGMTVERMTSLDLGYAPPFSPVWDPVLVAARKAVKAVAAAD